MKSLRSPQSFNTALFADTLEVFIALAIYLIFHSILLAALAFLLTGLMVDFFMGLGEGILDELNAFADQRLTSHKG